LGVIKEVLGQFAVNVSEYVVAGDSKKKHNKEVDKDTYSHQFVEEVEVDEPS
jgi:hypothetical protein